MATLHLMVGLPCSGKTTLARQLEQKYAALRLTPDEWHTRLFGQDVYDPNHDDRHTTIEALLWDVAVRVLALGVDVILDFGFWAASERADYRLRAAYVGADTKIHFPNVGLDELLARLAVRNAQLPTNSFYIPESMLKDWATIFVPPTQDELAYTLMY